ncbi:MAG: hypothetical protein J5656_05395 [Clostridia bacterium]|nr:hypothetical protein [Clostridia bacterium]
MTKKKRKDIKFIIRIVTAIVVMVGCITMVGVSYAWFTNSTQTGVATIELSTTTCFVLSFSFGNEPEGGYPQYTGQYGYRNAQGNNHVVTSEFATNILGYPSGSINYDSYMLDKPYEVGAQFNIDTENKAVEFMVEISAVHITLDQENGDPPITLMMLTDKDLIKYGFTWYIKDGNDIYTPYRGTKTYNAITDTNNKLPLANGEVATKWTTTPQALPIQGYVADHSSAYLYLVFCPEKAYWYQYGNNLQSGKTKRDWVLNMDEIYSADELNKINHLSSYPALNGVTYSDSSYIGATFSFDVTVTVLSVAEV